MKRFTNEEFIRSLLETGGYRTPPERRAKRPGRAGWWNAFRYAGTILGIIFRSVARFLIHRFGYADWQRFAFQSIAFAERVGSEVTIEGFETIKAHGKPVVYVMNHMSTLETMIAPALLIPFGNIAIVLKKSLDELPFVGRASRSVGSIAVTRKNARDDLKTVLTEGCKRIADGRSVLLYPQGTRQSVFDPKRFNSLGAKLAERAGVALVPIAVRTDILQTGKLIRDFGKVDPSKPLKVACGPILDPSLGASVMHERSLAFIMETLEHWGLPIQHE